MQLHFFNVRATTSVVAKICKTQKVFNFAHFNPKNTSVHVKMCKYTKLFCKWAVTVHICMVTVYVQMIFLFFFPLSLICLLLIGPLTLTSLSLFSFFSLSASTLSALCFSHLISFLFHGRTHRSVVLCIMSADQSWVEWVSGLDAPGLWRSFHGWTVGGVDLVGQSSLSLTLYDLYRRWIFFVSSGFCDFDKWVFGSLDLGRLMMVIGSLDFCCVAWWWWLGRLMMDLWIWVFGGWLMVAQLNGYVNFIDGSLVEWDGGWVIVWLDGGGWVVGWWWLWVMLGLWERW